MLTMTFDAFLLTLSFLLCLFNHEVFGYYCEWDLCGSDQYCCGDNLCCEYVYSLWYFWVGILFVVILLSACGGLFRYCYYSNTHLVTYRLPTYSPVPNDSSDNFVIFEREAPANVYSGHKLPGYFPPRDPPPPYSATVSNSSTSSSAAPSTGSDHHGNKRMSDSNLYIYP